MALLGLMVLLVPFAIIAVVIYVDDPGKVLFARYRIGRRGKHFKLYKFRTMKRDAPKYLSTSEVSDPDACITRVGHFLRKYSLDELPQLINVIKGDMSLAGPRPLIADEYETYGHLNVPATYIDRSGFALGKWVRRHRERRANGTTAIKLTTERQNRLSQIGMIWKD